MNEAVAREPTTLAAIDAELQVRKEALETLGSEYTEAATLLVAEMDSLRQQAAEIEKALLDRERDRERRTAERAMIRAAKRVRKTRCAEEEAALRSPVDAEDLRRKAKKARRAEQKEREAILALQSFGGVKQAMIRAAKKAKRAQQEEQDAILALQTGRGDEEAVVRKAKKARKAMETEMLLAVPAYGTDDDDDEDDADDADDMK